MVADEDTPTPAEFIEYDNFELNNIFNAMIIRYVLHELRFKTDVNAHWRPQHRCCPVCLLEFR